MTLTFEELCPLEDPDWDGAIAKFASKHLFHERAWLRFLSRSQNARIHGTRLVGRDGGTVGYFVAGEVRKGPFRLLGSPLQGWSTPFMGPVTDEVPDTFFGALDVYARALGVDYLEMSNPGLPASTMRDAGYDLDADQTFLVPVGGEAEMWGRLSSECRNRIRRAMRSGLRVESVTERTFVETYYAQLREVFARQALVPTYGIERVENLWDALMTAGKLLALRVTKGGETLACGLFPFDDRALFFWGGAAWTHAYADCPNELLHWRAMCVAAERAIPLYNMSGVGRFKAKFGGTAVTVERWYKTFTPLARLGRFAYQRYVGARQRMLGGLHRLGIPR
ncbi:MAG TPA: GNAT family N-acetyltransferase [Candidatus Acidoferrum sp.]|nr:GNAT family N-acetyltransferase [Candidatus Acidoferrum sp.]